MLQQDEVYLRSIISRYEQKIFALALYLIGGDKDKAYNVATSSFVEALRETPFLEKENISLSKIAGIAVEKCRDIKTILSPDENDSDFVDLPPVERQSLLIVKTALQKLPFDIRALVLLRDQLHLPYKSISSIFKISQGDAKVQTTQARIKLRETIKELLDHGR